MLILSSMHWKKGREVHKTLTFATPETETNQEGATTWKRTTNELKSAFKTYCNPRKNITFERHKFNIRNQEENESIDQYVTVLRTLAAPCEFETLHDGLIRDRIVCGIRNQSIKERLLRESELTLQKTLDICRASEVSRKQVKLLSDQSSANVDALGKDQRKHRNFRNHNNKPENGKPPNKSCGNCGRVHEPKSCPAYGKKCNNCQKLGHFAKLCRSQAKNPKKSVHDVDYESDSSTHGIDMAKTAVTSDNDEEHASLKINNTTIRIKLDSGAETNVLTKKDFEAAVPKRQRRSKLKTGAAKLTAFGGHNIPIIGKCYLKCQYKGATE
ncbi:retrotransposon-like family member retr-1, partial [Paramuricea clavata]